MPIDVRPVRDDELPAYFDVVGTAFLERFDIDRVAAEVRPFWDLSRVFVAVGGDRVVGTLRSWGTELTVPGGRQVPGAAVTNVTVLPTQRRRGTLTAMIDRTHRDARERGEAVALLYAAEYPIYGRFGYGAACRVATWILSSRETSFTGAATGSMELVPPAQAAAALPDVYEQWRCRRTGEIRRLDYRWEFELGLHEQSRGNAWRGRVALHRNDAGVVDGYVRYTGEEKWEQNLPRGVITVDELHGVDDAAYDALWRYVGEIDLVARVKAEWRHPNERLPWLLTNFRAALPTDIGDGMWVRLLDVPAALSARTYNRSADLVLELVDDEAPGGSLRLRLEASPDGAVARRTTASPDLTCHVSALGAAYLGGVRLRDAVVERGVDEHRPGALAAADALFRTVDEPWSSTFF
jgi:predicted acetyltransferase